MQEDQRPHLELEATLTPLERRAAWRRWLATTGAVLLLVALTGCASTSDSDAAPPADDGSITGSGFDDLDMGAGEPAEPDEAPAPGKYEQTWRPAYGDTTCQQWLSDMDEHQQFVAAADMLTGARNKGDDGTGLPDDALVEEFAGGITTACVEPTIALDEMAAMLYLTERDRFSP